MKASSIKTEWMDRLVFNLRVLKDEQPIGTRKLVLHDAAETLEYLCKIIDRKNGIKSE